MKAMFAVLLILSTGLWAVAQETASKANGKQGTTRELTNPGERRFSSGDPAGETNYVPLWRTPTFLGTSEIYQTSGDIGIGTTTPTATLDVNGAVNAATSFNLGGNLFAFGSYAYGNTFFGFAGNTTTTGSLNAANGYSALHSNTTGSGNTATGYYALTWNTEGSENTASGLNALGFNTTGNYNTAFGSGAGITCCNTEGVSNTTAIGANATVYSQSNATAIGANAVVSGSNATAIGANATVTRSNALVLGGVDGLNGATSNTNVGIGTTAPSNIFTIGQGAGPAIADGWDTYSSRRWKTNIQTLHGALGKVQRLRGVSYDLKDSGKHEIGVIGEEVGAVVPEVVTWEKNGTDAQGVDYGRLTALLIEATKEQQALIHQQQEHIQAQQSQIKQLTRQVREVQAALKASSRTNSEIRTVKAEVPVLHQ